MLNGWITAARPRTLPLAFSSILMGSFIAAWHGFFRWEITVLALVTTTCLQVLSNLANDYGDSLHGADHQGRNGPARMVQAGIISPEKMKWAIVLFVFFALITGTTLLIVTFGLLRAPEIGAFLLIGVAAIFAAVKYTAGSNPYGYAGLGDLSVLLFFGFVGVAGTYYLQTGAFKPSILLPALSSGLLAVGVLNINNIRDIDSDRVAKKMSVPVRIGKRAAQWYHLFLLVCAIECALVFLYLEQVPWPGYLSFLTLPLFMYNIQAVFDKDDLDPYLKQLAISSLIFSVCFGMFLLLSEWLNQLF